MNSILINGSMRTVKSLIQAVKEATYDSRQELEDALERLAEVELFLFVSRPFRDFQVERVIGGELPSLNRELGIMP